MIPNPANTTTVRFDYPACRLSDDQEDTVKCNKLLPLFSSVMPYLISTPSALESIIHHFTSHYTVPHHPSYYCEMTPCCTCDHDVTSSCFTLRTRRYHFDSAFHSFFIVIELGFEEFKYCFLLLRLTRRVWKLVFLFF